MILLPIVQRMRVKLLVNTAKQWSQSTSVNQCIRVHQMHRWQNIMCVQGESQDELRLDEEMDRVVWSEGAPPSRLPAGGEPVRDTAAPPPPYTQGNFLNFLKALKYLISIDFPIFQSVSSFIVCFCCIQSVCLMKVFMFYCIKIIFYANNFLESSNTIKLL